MKACSAPFNIRLRSASHRLQWLHRLEIYMHLRPTHYRAGGLEVRADMLRWVHEIEH